MANFIAVMCFVFTIFYSFLYFYVLRLQVTALVAFSFACAYLLYYFFVAHKQFILGVYYLFAVYFFHVGVIVIFFISSHSGFHFFYFLASPAIFFINIRPEKIKTKLIFSFVALFLFISCEIVGDRYATVILDEEVYRILNATTLLVVFMAAQFISFLFYKLLTKREDLLLETHKELQTMAYSDPLTGIANRRRMLDFFRSAWIKAAELGDTISLLECDIDHFKNINDTYGHDKGDEILNRVASILGECIRSSTDLLARHGGEEFIVILPKMDQEESQLVADRMRLAVEHSFQKSVALTISIGGCSICPEGDIDFDSLFLIADNAMYEAKKRGRNCVVHSGCISVWNPEISIKYQ
jgi:diguanylate cyclase (GGDEF)-like protein